MCTTLFTLTACGGSDGKVYDLNAQIEDLTKQINEANDKIATLEAEKNDLAAENSNLKEENSNLKEENEELKVLVEALRNCLKDIHNYVDGFCTTCGKEDESELAYTRDGDYIYFGEYPQTIKADDVTITDTIDDRGYYLGSDGFFYAKVTGNPLSSTYTFSTGTTITSGTVYYFKVEPIRWRILSEENGVAFILCDSIIANLRYAVYSNNYVESEIRAWLNSTFYDTAFSELARSIILVTEVDNSALSAGYSDCEYACENTNDKIFLLSFKEAINKAYGFDSTGAEDSARRMLTSDYSKATGAFTSTSLDYYGTGYWWLRSPHGLKSSTAKEIDYLGRANSSARESNTKSWGVVPALRITL